MRGLCGNSFDSLLRFDYVIVYDARILGVVTDEFFGLRHGIEIDSLPKLMTSVLSNADFHRTC